MNWRTHPIAIVDTETTGVDPATARIVDLGIVCGETKRGWLIDPGVPIPAECTAIHGITDAMVEGAPTFGEVAAEFVAMVGDAIPAAYNSRFDRAVLLSEFLRAGLVPPAFLHRGDEHAWIDVLAWARALAPYAKGQKLEIVAERLGVERGEAHRAVGDCETTKRVLDKLSRADLHPDAGVTWMPDSFADLVLHQRRLTAERDASYLAWRIKKEKAA